MSRSEPQLAPREAESGLNDLKKRGMSAYRAYLCCKNAGLRQKLALMQAADYLIEWFDTKPNLSLITAFPRIPEVEPVFRIRNAPAGYPRLFVSVPGVSEIPIDMPEIRTEVQRMASFLRAVGTEQRTRDRNCEKCIRQNMWGNQKPRRRGLWTSGATGETNRLRIRVPHR